MSAGKKPNNMVSDQVGGVGHTPFRLQTARMESCPYDQPLKTKNKCKSFPV
jgi:hypothetical protein